MQQSYRGWVLGTVAFWMLPTMSHSEAAAPTAQGKYIALAADCMSCHTAPDGKPFAGGNALKSPVGTLYGPNITSDIETGTRSHPWRRASRASSEQRFTQLTAADGVDTTFFGFDSDGNGLPNFFGTSAAAPDAAAVGALVLQSFGGPGSLAPHALYARMQNTADPIPVPDDRSFAAATAGPVSLTMNGDDWVRSNTYFTLSVDSEARHYVASITFDATAPGLTWSANPNRFSIGTTDSVQITDITATPTGSVWALKFAEASFGRDNEFTFGMSVFNPAQGSTEEDPDRFRNMTMTVVMDNGKTYTGKVLAGQPLRQNRFTGAGLVDAARAVKK